MLTARGFQHAMRLLLELARTSGRLGTRELARRAGVPPYYAGKLMTALVTAGLVDGRRGRYGGVVLARAPAEIDLKEVMMAVGPATRHGCALGGLGCPRRPCAYHPACRHLDEALDSALLERTLAHLTAPEVRAPSRPDERSEASPDVASEVVEVYEGPFIEDELL